MFAKESALPGPFTRASCNNRSRDQYRSGGVDPLPTFVASLTVSRVHQRSVIRAGLLVMLTTGSHQVVGSSYGPPRSVYLTLSLPLARQPHHEGER